MSGWLFMELLVTIRRGLCSREQKPRSASPLKMRHRRRGVDPYASAHGFLRCARQTRSRPAPTRRLRSRAGRAPRVEPQRPYRRDHGVQVVEPLAVSTYYGKQAFERAQCSISCRWPLLNVGIGTHSTRRAEAGGLAAQTDRAAVMDAAPALGYRWRKRSATRTNDGRPKDAFEEIWRRGAGRGRGAGRAGSGLRARDLARAVHVAEARGLHTEFPQVHRQGERGRPGRGADRVRRRARSDPDV